VRPDASQKLKQLSATERELSEKLEGIVRRLDRQRGDPHPSLGHERAPARRPPRAGGQGQVGGARVPGLLLDRSSSGETAFIEPRECTEPAHRLAGVEIDLRREQQRILLELTRELLAEEPRLVVAAARLAELELALISALYCREHGARVPEVAPLEGTVPGRPWCCAARAIPCSWSRRERASSSTWSRSTCAWGRNSTSW
jgi:DNA mismatch repair protein MutS2